eukprot:scaffold5849_cov120-Skeletonema_dohrnii-CCMP3373.AAC.2
MLMPIIAAIGSFWVSERVLKPKATALFILSCLAIYDVFISPPIPILRQSTHRGDEIVELLDNHHNEQLDNNNNNKDDENYYKLYNQQEEDDLATSLRCYRGPLLLAVALFCAAYSLRVWRRGGCACDELLFLPGTPHEHAIIARSSGGGGDNNNKNNRSVSKSGDDNDVEMMPLNDNTNSIEQQQSSPLSLQTKQRNNNSSSIRTAIPFRKSPSSPTIHGSSSFNNSSLMIEASFSEGDAAAGGGTSTTTAKTERQSLLHDTEQLLPNSPPSPSSTQRAVSPLLAADDSPMGYLRERAWSGLNMLVITENFGGGGVPSLPELSENDNEDGNDTAAAHDDDNNNSSRLQVLSGSGSGESNATTTTTTSRRKSSITTTNNNSNDNNNKERYDVDYAPSGPSVLGAALDLTLPVLFNFHMFVVLMKDHYKKEAIEAGIVLSSSMEDGVITTSEATTTAAAVNDSDDTFGGALQLFTPPEVPPKVLPLIFLSGVLVRTQFPRRQRVRFYKTILQGTILAPFKPVRFRDAFVGDIVTSLVRPIVDVVFTVTYYGAAVYGFCSRKYDLNETGYIVSESSLLHGIVLPLVAILPLWMRFLQTLRQAYDTGKRWPYLGNAFKYLTAGLVVLYGMTHAAGERGTWWIISFTAATLYQIVWDSCIDWELLVVVRNDAREMKESSASSSWWRCSNFISSLNPRLFPTTLLMYVVQPFRRRVSQPLRRVWELMPKRLDQIRLRPKRLFDDDKFYWRALFANAALRFCWMMGFIPAYRVSIMDGSTQETFADKFNGWSFVILGALEIFRRSIWGIIKVELETIKLTSGGDNDLTMASTADEYLREGKWNAWRRHGVSATNDDNADMAENEDDDEEDSQIIWLNPEKHHQSPGARHQTESFIFKHQSGNQTHRWLGITVSSTFIRTAYKVELLLWPVVFLVLSYMVILIE